MPTYKVLDCDKITASTLLLRLERQEWERPLSFQPGQYGAISFEHGYKKSANRCFSIVSSPTDQDILEFSMRVRGRYTTALAKLQKDDIVNVSGPFGGFVFDIKKDKKAVFLAGGIGITPFMSMARFMAALNSDNDITLLYSCAVQEDIPFKDELLQISKKCKNFKVVFVIGNGEADKLPSNNAVKGMISPELLEKTTDSKFSDYKFFICGPPGFMKAMSATILKNGVPKSQVVTEAFTQSSPKQTSILRSWPANAYALGAVGVILGSFVVMVSDLLKVLPPNTTARPTKNSPFLVTSARQEQLDKLVNSIPPSPSVITAPTAAKQQAGSQSQTVIDSSGLSGSSGSSTPSFAPIYAPAPTTRASVPPP